jgi:FixJ family two-component response regulator
MAPAAVPTAYVVDDDESIRALWQALMQSHGHAVRTFATAAEFLDSYSEDAPGCLILDFRMPGMNGLELQQYVKAKGFEIPVIFVTGHGDIPTAVSALKGGAFDFIEKPFAYREVLALVDRAFQRDAEIRRERVRRREIEARIAALTERERDLLRRVIEG